MEAWSAGWRRLVLGVSGLVLQGGDDEKLWTCGCHSSVITPAILSDTVFYLPLKPKNHTIVSGVLELVRFPFYCVLHTVPRKILSHDEKIPPRMSHHGA